MRQELTDIVGLLRAHVQAQVDFGLDACLPPPDDWIGWQREGLSVDDIDWADRPPQAAQEKPKSLPETAADILDVREQLTKIKERPIPPGVSKQHSKPHLTLVASTPKPAAAAPTTAPTTAASKPLVGSGLFQDALQSIRQVSALDVSANAITKPPTLDDIQAAIRGCQRCVLHKNRTQTLPGEGDPFARIMFVCNPPTPEDDQQGRLLTGEAGALLDKILTAMGLSRAQVYITPILKCAPDPKQKPEPTCVSACEQFLNQQLDLIHPEVIIALGDLPAKTLTRSPKPLPILRGEWGKFRELPVMPTLDPAYLIEHPDAKPKVWLDMKAVLARLKLPLPSR